MVILFFNVSQGDDEAHDIFDASNFKPKVLDPVSFLLITHFAKVADDFMVLVALALAFDLFQTLS